MPLYVCVHSSPFQVPLGLKWVAPFTLKDPCRKWVEHGSLLRHVSIRSCSVLVFCLTHLEIWFFSESLYDRWLLTCVDVFGGCVGFTTLYGEAKVRLSSDRAASLKGDWLACHPQWPANRTSS